VTPTSAVGCRILPWGEDPRTYQKQGKEKNKSSSLEVTRLTASEQRGNPKGGDPAKGGGSSGEAGRRDSYLTLKGTIPESRPELSCHTPSLRKKTLAKKIKKSLREGTIIAERGSENLHYWGEKKSIDDCLSNSAFL